MKELKKKHGENSPLYQMYLKQRAMEQKEVKEEFWIFPQTLP
jgi:hypothetical protein